MPQRVVTSAGVDPFEQAHQAAGELARRTGHERHDALVVLGSGLGQAAPVLGAVGPPVDLTTLPWFPRFTALGHRSDAWSVQLGGRRVLVAAGRCHLYEGLTANQVTHTVRTAMAAGCRTVVLACAAGGIRPDLGPGAVVLVSDHLNLTGQSPLTGVGAAHAAGSPFVDLSGAYSADLRHRARHDDPDLPQGVYAQLPGPHFETPAEVRMLATMGADLVGMSMALETIAARHLGAEVLGVAVVANQAAGLHPAPLAADGMVATAAGAAATVARVVTNALA